MVLAVKKPYKDRYRAEGETIAIDVENETSDESHPGRGEGDASSTAQESKRTGAAAV